MLENGKYLVHNMNLGDSTITVLDGYAILESGRKRKINHNKQGYYFDIFGNKYWIKEAL